MSNNTSNAKNLFKIPDLLINRVYIRLGNNSNIKIKDGFYPLINAVALCHPTACGIILSEKKDDDVIIYSKRTQRFILHEVDDFIYHIGQRKALESMATYASLAQIRHIHNFLIGAKSSLPAYTAVIIYVVFKTLPPNCPARYVCQDILKQIHFVVHSYYLYNIDDELARFFEDSFMLVKNAMESNDASLVITDFPSIPREHPKDLNTLI